MPAGSRRSRWTTHSSPDMDRHDPSTRNGSTGRRAAIGRALLARDPVSANPDFLSLTEAEGRSGVTLFEGEDAGSREQGRTFERAPAEVAAAVPVHRIFESANSPTALETRSVMLWRALCRASWLAGMATA